MKRALQRATLSNPLPFSPSLVYPPLSLFPQFTLFAFLLLTTAFPPFRAPLVKVIAYLSFLSDESNLCTILRLFPVSSS